MVGLLFLVETEISQVDGFTRKINAEIHGNQRIHSNNAFPLTYHPVPSLNALSTSLIYVQSTMKSCLWTCILKPQIFLLRLVNLLGFFLD